MRETRGVLSKHQARAAPREDTRAAIAEAVKHAKRPVALTGRLERLVGVVAIATACSGHAHHGRALGLLLLALSILRRELALWGQLSLLREARLGEGFSWLYRDEEEESQ